jgi:hypothetical protein
MCSLTFGEDEDESGNWSETACSRKSTTMTEDVKQIIIKLAGECAQDYLDERPQAFRFLHCIFSLHKKVLELAEDDEQESELTDFLIDQILSTFDLSYFTADEEWVSSSSHSSNRLSQSGSAHSGSLASSFKTSKPER